MHAVSGTTVGMFTLIGVERLNFRYFSASANFYVQTTLFPMSKSDLKDRSDGDLIQLYVQRRNESDAALRVLIERHNQKMFDRFLSKVHDKTIASDLVQELWTKVAANLHRYKDEGKFEHYLSKLHSNVRIDFYRKSGRDKDVFVDNQAARTTSDLANGDNEFYADNYEDPGQDAEQQVSNDALAKYLSEVLIPALPIEQRAAWLLRHESEYWEPARRFEWCHLAKLNNLTEEQTAAIFDSARHKLMTTATTGNHSALEEIELLVFLVWTQAQRLDKSQKFTWDYFAEILGQPVNTMKTRYRTAQKSLQKSLAEYMQS